jgi:hypothetical protein
MTCKKINYKLSCSLLPPLVIALKPHDEEVVIRSEAIGLYSSNYTRTELGEASFNDWGCLVSFIALLIFTVQNTKLRQHGKKSNNSKKVIFNHTS